MGIVNTVTVKVIIPINQKNANGDYHKESTLHMWGAFFIVLHQQAIDPSVRDSVPPTNVPVCG